MVEKNCYNYSCHIDRKDVIEEHVVYATCVVKVTKENFAGQEGLDESVQKMIADGKFGERYFALIKRPEAGDKK